MKFVWCGIFLVFCCREVVPLNTDSASEFPWVSQFNYIDSIAKILTKKFDAYVQESASHETAKEQKKQEFLSSFDALYKDDSKRLFDMIVTYQHNSSNLQNDVVAMFEKDYQKSKEFFLRIEKTFIETCGNKVNYLIEKGKASLASEEIQFSKTAVVQIKAIFQQVLQHLKTTAWKTQFIIDVRSFIENNGPLQNIHKEVLNMLAKKYPFRNWLVISYDKRVSNSFCVSHDRVYPFSTSKEGSLLVLQTDKESKWDQMFANRMLRKASESSYAWRCASRAPSISKEVTSDCREDKIPFLGVFMETSSSGFRLPTVETNASNRLSARRVRRGTWTDVCVEYYELIIFG